MRDLSALPVDKVILEGSLVDNRREYNGQIVTLQKVIQGMAVGSEGLKCAVGYFYIEGLALIIEHLKALKQIRILIGSETTQLTKDKLISAFKERFDSIEENDTTIPSIKLFYQLVGEAKTLKVRAYFGDQNRIERLHSKAYFFIRSIDSSDILDRYRAGVVGSSNLTPSGLTGNTELNVMIDDRKDLAYLESWFDNLWDRGTEEFEKLRVSEALLEGIDRSKFGKHLKDSYRYLDPREFFKQLILFRNADYLFEDWSESKLLKFQQVDALRCLTLYTERNYRGVFLTSSVGLGKSYVACHAAKYFLRNDQKVLLIAPSGLLKSPDQWPRYLKEFKLLGKIDVKREGKLRINPELFDDSECDKNYGLIIIDEAHYFRNEDAFRTKNLKRIIDRNGDAKLLFLTATPINTNLSDLQNLIKLFYRKGQNPDFDLLYWKLNEILRLTKDVSYEQLTEEEKETISQQQEEIEKGLFVKSTRETIKNSDEYVREVEFFSKVNIRTVPDPDVTEVAYTLHDKYGPTVNGIVDFINGFKAAHLRILDPEKGMRLSGFIKWILYKRFESDITSYYLTLRRLLKKNKMVLAAIELADLSALDLAEVDEDDEIEVTFGSDFKQKLGDVIEAIKANEGSVHLAILPDLKDDISKIEAEIEKLKRFLEPGKSALFSDDEKLIKLSSELREHSSAKILIFTEYKDTLEAIREFLGGTTESGQVRFVDSNTKNKNAIIKNFNESEEPRIIVTTDTLAEGYNIGGTDIVVNFDIPFNPVKIIQRIGRATRLDQPKPIKVLNFRPDESIDQELKLVHTLQIRIEEIIKWVGIEYRIWFEREKELVKLRRKKDATLYLDILRTIRKDQWRGDFERLEVQVPYTKPSLALMQSAIQKYGITKDDISDTQFLSGDLYTLLEGKKNLVVFYDKSRSFNEDSVVDFSVKEYEKWISFDAEFKAQLLIYKEYVKKENEKRIKASYTSDRLDKLINSIEDRIQTDKLDQRFSNANLLSATLEQAKKKSGSTTERVIKEIHKGIRRDRLSEARVGLWVEKLKNSLTKMEIVQERIDSKKRSLAIGFMQD
jgi:superfamily II DNA or RNA helicase/HKD family nuclease